MTVDLEGLSSLLLDVMHRTHAELSGEDQQYVDAFKTEHFRVELARVFGVAPSARLAHTCASSECNVCSSLSPPTEEATIAGVAVSRVCDAFTELGLIGRVRPTVSLYLYPAEQKTGGGLSNGSYYRNLANLPIPDGVDLMVSIRRTEAGGVAIAPEEIAILLRRCAENIDSDPSIVRPVTPPNTISGVMAENAKHQEGKDNE